MEKAIIDALQAGDQAAWSSFFAEFDPLLRSVAAWSKWRFPPHIQQDLVQDIRTELMRSVANFRQESSLAYFVKRICIHRCIDQVRRQVKQRETHVSLAVVDADGSSHDMDLPAGEEFDPIRAVVRFELASALKIQLDELDETCRTAVRQFYLDGLSYKEMSRKLGVAVNTVGSRLAKCLDKLRGLIAKNPSLREYFLRPNRQ